MYGAFAIVLPETITRWQRGITSEIAAIVLFVVPTISSRPLYGLLTMDMAGSNFCGSELLHIQRPNGSPISS